MHLQTHTAEKPYTCKGWGKSSGLILTLLYITEYILKKNLINIMNVKKLLGIVQALLHITEHIKENEHEECKMLYDVNSQRAPEDAYKSKFYILN